MPDSPRRVRTRNSSWTATGKKLAQIIEQIRDLDEEHGLGHASFVNRTRHVTTNAKRAANRCHAWEYPSSVPMSCLLSHAR